MKAPPVGTLVHIAAYLALVGLFIDDRLRTHLRIGRLETDAAAARRLSSADSEPTSDTDGALWEARQSLHGVRLDELKAQVQADLASAAETTRAYIDARLDEDSRRRAQGAEPEPEPEPLRGENVKIIKPAVVRCGGPGGTTADGHFDYSQCAEHTFAVCHATACAGHTGHRRTQAGGTCDATRLAQDSDAINRECCDEPTEDCTGGSPHTCNAGCGALLLPFWADCRGALGKQSAQFEGAVALCEQSTVATAGPASLAEQLGVQCTDGTAAADCVPGCSEEYHGYLMLLNIEGDDSKLSCELHHGLYSWVGAAVSRTLARL